MHETILHTQARFSCMRKDSEYLKNQTEILNNLTYFFRTTIVPIRTRIDFSFASRWVQCALLPNVGDNKKKEREREIVCVQKNVRRHDRSDWWVALTIGSNSAANIFGRNTARRRVIPATRFWARERALAGFSWVCIYDPPISDLRTKKNERDSPRMIGQQGRDFTSSLRFNA